MLQAVAEKSAECMNDTLLRLSGAQCYVRDISPPDADGTPGHGELYAGRAALGVGYYDPSLLAHVTTREDYPRPEMARPLRLPAETDTAWDVLDSSNGLIIEGDLGSGKGAVLHGLRQRMRRNQRPYALIDGHHSLSPRRIERIAAWTAKKGGVLFWDSLDYLAHKKKAGSKTRVEGIIPVLEEFCANDNHLVATTHTKPWLDKFCRPGVLEHLGRITTELPRYRVWGLLTDDGVQTLCSSLGAPQRQTESLLGHRTLLQEHAELFNAEDVQSFNQYRIVKLLLGHPDAWQLLSDEPTAVSLTKLMAIVADINHTSRQKMGATDNHQLVPA